MSRILVIDDEKNVRKMVGLLLVREGHDAQQAEDGPRGLEHFGDGSAWDLALVDQRMPGMDGRSVVREMLSRDPGARVVMMTAFDTLQLAGEMIQAGATDFLRKPLTTDALRRAVATALSQPRADAEGRANLHLQSLPSATAPGVSYWINGFRYWPADLSNDAGIGAQGLGACRVFEVSTAFEATRPCVVGLTLNVCQIARDSVPAGTEPPEAVWDVLCSGALSDYLWTNAQMPPELIPVYDLTLAQIEMVSSLARR
jgi:CheY-like chemotaxis protein